MKIKITSQDLINSNIEVARSLVNEALFSQIDEEKAKKLFLAYKNIENILNKLGLNPQDAF